jgi:Ser/Thr protein kinase RdoA (MazF antagonist)
MSYVASERIGFLSLDGQEIQKYTAVARLVLERHDLRVTDVSLIAAHSNVVFSVSAGDGTRYALRIGTDVHDAVDLWSELAFLIAVKKGTDIRVPVPVANRSGELVTTVINPDDRDCYECVLFTWLPGAPIGTIVTLPNYALMGEIAAKLHEFSGKWVPPTNFRPLVWDQLFYYPNMPDLIFEKGKICALLPQWSHDDIHYLAERATGELVTLDKLPAKRAIHGNIEMWNVVVDSDDQVGLLDFEEVILGQPVHDIAIALHYGRSRPDYTRLSEAFRVGYERIAPWPVDSDIRLDLLSAARGILFLNFALQRTPIPRDFIERECHRLVALRRQIDVS